MFQHYSSRSPNDDPPKPTPPRVTGGTSYDSSYQPPRSDAYSWPSNTDATINFEDSAYQHNPNHVSHCLGIIPPVHRRALDYFLSTHVFQDCGTARGFYEYLPAYINDFRTDRTLSTSLTAAALACYANTFDHPNFLGEARRQYGHALRLVNSALSCPKGLVKDSTLISILLLSTFGTLTLESVKSLSQCASHMSGALTLVTLRGCHLVESPQGLQLFLHICTWYSLNCILASVRIPEEFINIRNHASKFHDACDPAWQLFELVVQLANFRADIKNGELTGHQSIPEAAAKLDMEFSCFARKMPLQWQFETVSVKGKSELVYGTCYHVYPDLWMAYVWNNLRTCRMLLHREICKRLKPLIADGPRLSASPRTASDYENSSRILHKLATDICATIPQYSGHLRSLSGSASLNKLPCTIASNGVPTIAGAYFLCWPLYNAGQVAESDSQRAWIISRCHYLGKMTGIQQMHVLADVLKNREEHWL